MIKAFQKCRICGVQIPSGFTNCDDCYEKSAPPADRRRHGPSGTLRLVQHTDWGPYSDPVTVRPVHR